ncbi:MAG: hypothetical protein NTZ46_05105 [Verrucomicrobia bacterium]|nr:hypothetical protein [Verrucomicrobiota bacterium]
MTVRFERRDIDPGSLGCIGLVFVASLILSTLATMLLYRAFSVQTQITEGPITEPMPAREKVFPNPQLQFYPPEDLAKFRQQQEAALNGYRWVDRKTGVVGIPIQRAMELLVQQGEPILGAPSLPQGPTWVEMMQRRAEQGKEPAP